MGFQVMMRGSSQGRYLRLQNEVEKAARRPRRLWLRKVNGRLISFRISPSKRLKWMRFIVLRRRVAELYADVVKTVWGMDADYPAIIFSCHWGLPVLSHPSIDCRKRVVSLHRNLSLS